ncbi:MAG: hypothetical protein AB1426_06600 [Bacillota bacterium]
MGYIGKLFKLRRTDNSEYARLKLASLVMEVSKRYIHNTPHEVSIIVPRVELSETIKAPFFTLTREVTYNSVTIVIAPRAPLTGEVNDKTFSSLRQKLR